MKTSLLTKITFAEDDPQKLMTGFKNIPQGGFFATLNQGTSEKILWIKDSYQRGISLWSGLSLTFDPTHLVIPVQSVHISYKVISNVVED